MPSPRPIIAMKLWASVASGQRAPTSVARPRAMVMTSAPDATGKSVATRVPKAATSTSRVSGSARLSAALTSALLACRKSALSAARPVHLSVRLGNRSDRAGSRADVLRRVPQAVETHDDERGLMARYEEQGVPRSLVRADAEHPRNPPDASEDRVEECAASWLDGLWTAAHEKDAIVNKRADESFVFQ